MSEKTGKVNFLVDMSFDKACRSDAMHNHRHALALSI